MFVVITLIGWALMIDAAENLPPAVATAATTRIADRLLLTISPHIVMAGKNVRTIVRLDRNAANRCLRITIDGPLYGASTERQLMKQPARQRHPRCI